MGHVCIGTRVGEIQGNRIRKCGCYLRLTSYELRFIDHVRVAQFFSNHERRQESS